MQQVTSSEVSSKILFQTPPQNTSATTQAIVGCMKKELMGIKGLAEQKVDKIVEAAQKLAFDNKGI